MRKRALLLSFLLCTTLPASPCEVLQALSDVSAEYATVFTMIKSLNPDLVSGNKTPKWQDLNDLKNLRDAVIGMDKSVPLPKVLVEDIQKLATTDPALSAVTRAHETPPEAGNYRGNDYDLRMEYQRLLYEIVSSLPHDLKFKLPKIPFDEARVENLRQARERHRKHEEAFERLYSTTGFKDESEFRAAVKKMGPEAEKLLEMIDHNQLGVAFTRPHTARWWAMRGGFHNQFVTGSSGGYLGADKRNKVEAYHWNQSVESYSEIDPRLKPNYGAIVPPPGSPLKDDTGTDYYGRKGLTNSGDRYYFDVDKISDRLTWSPGDSLNRHVYGNFSDPASAQWDQTFVPWKQRHLMLASLLKAYRAGSIGTSHSSPTVEGGLKMGRPSPDAGYVEVQFSGPLGLDQVKAFEFSQYPPEGEFLAELKKRGIKIYDGREKPAVEWSAPE